MSDNIIQARAIQQMFKAVIVRAVSDAMFSTAIDTIDKERAISWLCGNTEKDLRLVCSLAGVSADRIIQKSRKLFASGRIKEKDLKEIKKQLRRK